MDATAFASLTAELVDSGNRIAAVADVQQRNAVLLAWGIEAGLLTQAECHAAFQCSPEAALALLRKRFHDAIAIRIEQGLGIDIRQGDDNATWTAWLDDDVIRSNHYVEFEADRLRWLNPEARRAWEKLLKHRCFLACTAADLWGQSGMSDVTAAIADFDPQDHLASWERYLAHPSTEAEDGNDFTFASFERYSDVMCSLRDEPRGSLLSAVMEYDAGGLRSAAVLTLCQRAVLYLTALERECVPEPLYSLGDEMTPPAEACVLLPSPGAAVAVQIYFDDRYQNSSEAPGNELGIELGAGERPLRRALYCVATRAILQQLDTILELPA